MHEALWRLMYFMDIQTDFDISVESPTQAWVKVRDIKADEPERYQADKGPCMASLQAPSLP
jgi:hypothetical protein